MRALYLLAILLFSFSYLSVGQKNTTNLFLKAKGSLSYPVKNIIKINTFNDRKNICDGDIGSKSTIFYTDSIQVVSAIFKGKVDTVVLIDNFYVIIVRHGKYFFTYAGVVNPIVKKGDFVEIGQALSSTGKDFDDKFCVEIYLTTAKNNIDPYPWFKPKELH